MTWAVHPHGDLLELADGLWVVTGSMPGSGLPRNMVVFRLPQGGLLIHSAVNLDRTHMDQLEALGHPSVLVVPNGLHRLDAPAWKERYPDVVVVAPAGSRRQVEKVIGCDATAEEALPRHGVICHQPSGLKPAELFYELPLADDHHALVLTDTLFNLEEHQPGIVGFFLRYVTGSTGHFGTTRLSRFMLVQDSAAFSQWLRDQAERPGLTAVLVAHGAPIVEGCADMLRQAADRG